MIESAIHHRSRGPRPALLAGLALAILALGAGPALGHRGAPPASDSLAVRPLAQVDVLEVPAIDAGLLASEDDKRLAGRTGPLGYASPHAVEVRPATSGTWDVLPDGARLWRLRVHAPGATDLNFGFHGYELPEGAALHVREERGDYYQGPYGSSDNNVHRQLWTPVVPGDRAVIELYLPASPKDAAAGLELVSVNRGYRDLFRRGAEPESGPCNIDVVCGPPMYPWIDPFRNQIRSEAVISTGGATFCSGQMLDNVQGDCKPFFLTADHCGIRAGNAPTLVAYWNYQTTTCGGPRDGMLTDNTTGATFRATNNGPDFTLVEFNNPPDPLYQVYFTGWDATTTTRPQSSVAIHHPNTDEKAISLNTNPLTIGNSCIGGATPNSHWFVDNWEFGTTEPGSSGSGLWDPATRLLVGQLSGGRASCTVIDYDCFGLMSMNWDLGATPASRLRDWLDPLNTGTRTAPGRDCSSAVGMRYRDHRSTDTCAQTPSNNNGVWEPGEEVVIEVDLASIGDQTNVVGTLTSPTPGVAIIDGSANWPNLTSGITTTSLAPHFRVMLGTSVPCYSTVNFVLTVTSAQGGPFALAFSHDVGALSTGAPVAIPDQGMASSPLAISATVPLAGVRARVQIDHTWVGDLILRLQSPMGTQVTLLDRPGVPATSTVGCGDNNLDVTFDDAAATTAATLEAMCSGMDATPWYVGTGRPVTALAALAAEPSAGTWQLLISDNAAQDTGNVVSWELLTNPPVSGTCQTCGTSSCTGIQVAVNTLKAVKNGTSIAVQMPSGPVSACAVGLQVRMATTGRPASGSGMFPADPAFANITSQDTDPGQHFAHPAPAGDGYYKIVEDLPGGLPGPSGSYNF